MYTIIRKYMYTIIHECNMWNAWRRVHGDVSAYGYPTPTLTLLALVLAILRRNTGWGRMVNMGRIKELGAGSCAPRRRACRKIFACRGSCACVGAVVAVWVVVWGGSGSGRPIANSKRSNERRKWERRTKSKRRKKNLLSLLLFYFYV